MDERTEGGSTLGSFWETPERKTALRILQQVYNLTVTEVFCFRRAVLEIPYDPQLTDEITAFVAELANDLREYFMQNCPNAKRSVVYKQSAIVFADAKRKRRHEELRERARFVADEIMRNNARVINVLSFHGQDKAKA